MADPCKRPPENTCFGKHRLMDFGIGGTLLVITLLGSAGCRLSSQGPVPRSAAEIQVLNEVQDLSYARLTAALAQLDSVNYRELVSLQELAVPARSAVPAGGTGSTGIDDSAAVASQVLGSSTYIKTLSLDSGIRIDSSTTSFDVVPSSVIKGLTDEALAHDTPRLPFDLPPVFVSAKRIDDFTYSRSDTTVAGKRYEKYVVSKIGQPATKSPTTTLLVLPDSSREVIRVIDRSHSAVFLFRTENDVDLGVALVDSTWLPSRFHYALTIKSPFRKERSFVVQKTYTYN